MFWTGLTSSGSMPWRRSTTLWWHWKIALVLAVVALVSAGLPGTAIARQAAPAVGTVRLSDLPSQAQDTYRLVFSGGPFPDPKDGVVFGNRERQLPRQARGYYHEYTVKTPGARDRGARRIVCGGLPPNQPVVCYYTDDHYASYRQISP